MTHKFISHRGNIYASDFLGNSFENTPDYIDTAIKLNFDVEVDVWSVNGLLYLGHDVPETRVPLSFFKDRFKYLWIHLKNVEAVSIFLYNDLIDRSIYNYFWHEQDLLSITSRGYIWSSQLNVQGGSPNYIFMDSNAKFAKNSLNIHTILNNNFNSYGGICSDNITGVRDGYYKSRS